MRPIPLRAIAVAAATTLALGVGVSQAQAATWVKTANTTSKAYAVNGYKAKIGASGAPAVTGYSRYATTVSIKNSAGSYVARNVSAKWLSKGTYKVYSTFKYRKKIAHKSTVVVDGLVALGQIADGSCVLSEVEVYYIPDSDPPVVDGWSAMATCEGTYQGYPAYGVLPVGIISVGDYPVPAEGALVDPDNPLWDELDNPEDDTDLRYSGTKTVTTYTWSYTNRYRYRYATVKKVTEPRATWANCTTVNRKFPHGVGKSGAVDRTSGTRVTTFLRSNTVYAEAVRANGSLDRDRDGIACERR